MDELMNTPRTPEVATRKLAQLAREAEDLENARATLLERVEAMRNALMDAGNRTASIRGSVDMLCEHITNVVTTMAEIRVLEEQIQQMGQTLEANTVETSVLVFESESLRRTLDEAEEELERLSAILVDGTARNLKGH